MSYTEHGSMLSPWWTTVRDYASYWGVIISYMQPFDDKQSDSIAVVRLGLSHMAVTLFFFLHYFSPVPSYCCCWLPPFPTMRVP